MNIYGFTQNGVNVSVTALVFLTVEGTRIHDCASGIVTSASGANILVEADFSRASLWNNGGSGINAKNGSRLQVHNSTIFANSVGVNQTSLSGTGSTVTVLDVNQAKWFGRVCALERGELPAIERAGRLERGGRSRSGRSRQLARFERGDHGL